MALIQVSNQFVINSADTYVIGNASQAFVGTYAVHLVSNSFNGVIVPKLRSLVVGNSDVTPAFVEVPFLPLFLNGSVGTYGTGSSVDITNTSYILVPASGGVLALDCTTFTAGEMACYVIGQAGAAA